MSGFLIVPHNTNPMPSPVSAVYVGVGGDVTVRLVGDSADVVFKAVPSGTLLPISPKLVKATGTTASSLVGSDVVGMVAAASAGGVAPPTSQYADKVIADGASAYWRLGETSGLTAVDIVGGKNGTLSGGVTLNQSGALADGDKAMAFNGTTAKIAVASSITLASPWTFEGWIKTNVNAFNDLMTVTGAGQDQIQIYVDNSGQPTLWCNYTDASSAYVFSSAVIAPGQWCHLVVIVTGPTVAMFVNGVAVTVNGPLTKAPAAIVSPVDFGLVSGIYLNGSLDDIAIYPKALTQAQISAHYALSKYAAGSYPYQVVADGAAAYWRLGETSGLTAVDVVGGKNGTISGGVALNQPGALADGNKAMAFNGTTARIAVPAMLVPLSCSLELWVNSTVPGGMSVEHPVLSHRGPVGTDFVVSVATYWDPGRVRIYSGAGSVNGAGPVVDGAWHHVVIVFTGSGTTIYVDGAVDITGPVAHVAVTELLDIGWDTQNPTQSFTGSLDDVAIYPVVLTPAQIAAHYAARLLS